MHSGGWHIRRHFCVAWAVLLLAIVSGLIPHSLRALPDSGPAKDNYFVYVGTYTGPNSKGIYAYRFDAKTGHLTPLGLAAAGVNPSFVITDPHHRFLYAVNEVGNANNPDPNKKNGYLSSYAIDPKTGSLQFLNKVPSGGSGPCHIATDQTGTMLFAANYGSGSVASFAINPDGSIGAMTGVDQHSGSSVNPQRQEGPHAHSVVVSPDNRFLFVPDLGIDKILIYRVDAAKGTFTPNDPSSVSVKAGLGPRHFAFSKGAKFAYAICELGSSVVAFSYDHATGSLKPIQTISTLPADFTGRNGSAEIEVDHSGQHVYASNRGNDSIAVFMISQQDGTLTKIQVEPTQGKTPRNFALDPTGKFLLAANQDTNNIAVFGVDPKSGQLTPANEVVEVPSPVSIVFVPAAQD
jgi:6-phosphogluconolactonase